MNKLWANSPLFHTNWIVPRNVMCILFWTGVFVVFIGMILLVTSKHKGAAFLSWGGVVLGLGLCLLLICLMLCIHAYCVVANSSRSEDVVSYTSPVSSNTGIMVTKNTQREHLCHNLDQSDEFKSLQKSKNRPSAVRFNLVENCHQVERELTNRNLPPEATFYTEKNNHKSNHLAISPSMTEIPNEINMVMDCDDRQERYLSDHSIDKNKLNNISHINLPKDNIPSMSMTQNFGSSRITVTPIKHNHYEYHASQMDDLPSRLRAIQQGHIVTGNRPGFNPLFPDSSDGPEDPIINESELLRFPLMEIGDSKATVYDNVQYYSM